MEITAMIYRMLRTEYAIQAIETQSLKVGSMAELNDPSDCAPIINDLPERYDDFPDLAIRHIFGQVAESLGVLCFTEAIRDPVLWSHYGDSHRGVALGFDFPASEEVKPVQYSEDKPIISLWDVDTGVGTALVSSNALFTKATSWGYEQESRKVLRLADCKPKSGLYFYEFSKLSLKEVVIGDRCQTSKTYMYHLLESKGYSHVSVKTAINIRHSFKINIA